MNLQKIFKYYQAWAGQEIIDVVQIMPMWLEMIIGFVVLALCAFLSYLLVKQQRKKQLTESNNENETISE